MLSDGLGQVADYLGPKTSQNDMQSILQVSTHHHSTIQVHPASPSSPRGPRMLNFGRTAQPSALNHNPVIALHYLYD